MDDDEDGFDPIRFRRDSEVYEVDVGGSTSSGSAQDKPSECAWASGNFAERAAKKQHPLEFYLNGKPMDSKSSVFQAVLQANNAFVNADDPQSGPGGPSVWERVHTFTYKKRAAQPSSGAEEQGMGDDSSEDFADVSGVVDVKELVRETVCSGGQAIEELDEEIVGVLNLIKILVWLQGNYSR